jgi:hypothetical protein
MPLLQTIGSSAARAFGFTRGSANGGGGAMELISTQILSGTASSVTFSSIPTGTYKHLQIRAVTAFNAAGVDGLIARFNGDSAANYSWHYVQGYNSSVSSSGGGAKTSIYAGDIGSNSTANTFAAGIIDVLDAFSTTKNKTVRSLSGVSQTGLANTIALRSGAWFSTAAVSSLTLTSFSGGSFIVGSRFSLYGVIG